VNNESQKEWQGVARSSGISDQITPCEHPGGTPIFAAHFRENSMEQWYVIFAMLRPVVFLLGAMSKALSKTAFLTP
jgi:hypothetical protein